MIFLQELYCFCGRRLIVKFDPEHAFFKFPVVYDADIFNIDIVACQDGCYSCDPAGFIDDVAVDGELFFDRTCGAARHRITIVPGSLEQ